jgi:pimeloyl-ACP methyl ester carboxylesterase
VFIEVRDRLINTLCFGAGTQTLLAHGGFTGNYELWLQPFEILRRRHRTITYDHRGAGEHRRESQTPHGRSRRRRRRGR